MIQSSRSKQQFYLSGVLLFGLTLMIAALLAPAAARAASMSDTGSGAVSLAAPGTTYTQDFNTLINTAGSISNTTLPTGWYLTESGGGARDNELYAVDTGSSGTGDIYSYGAAGDTDRAFGALRSGTLIPLIGAKFVNNTGGSISGLAVAYTGEQWRLGTAGRTDQINFQYSTDATDLSTGNWVTVTGLIFVTPDTATTGAKNGNAGTDRTQLNATITGLNIADGATFFIRWTDSDATGADDGLAVDDFSITPYAISLSINDVSLNEGSSGTTAHAFIVSLSGPAPAGGVTFDIATADGTAIAPGDYTATSLTGQTIVSGTSTYTFTVQINGDTTPEVNENYFVNVTNVTNAAILDGQGQGTILNDDAAPNLTISDVILDEGNAGTTSFVFVVSLSTPAPTGGVTFDIATANGTATEPSDYTQNALLSQTIPEGSSTYNFTVSVNGDTTPENNETFVVNVTNVTNALVVDGQGQGTIRNDDLSKIHDVQGSGATSPLVGSTLSVEGVVVANFQGTGKLRGFFLQEEDADADSDPNTSEGIFVFCSNCPTPVAEGQRVKVTGTVSEFNGQTEITASTAGAVAVTDAGNHLAEVTPSSITLPIVGDLNAYYEAREGMLVSFADSLSVSEYFELARYGQIILTQGGRPFQFTETNPPSVAGNAAHADELARRQVILDDDNNAQEWYLPSSNPPGPVDGNQFIYYPRANGGFSVGTQGVDFFRGGDLVNGLTGVLDWSFPGFGPQTWRIRPTNAHPIVFTVNNPRPATPPAVGGSIKAVSMNLLNYFTSIDTTASNTTGPCGPDGVQDCRGADSVAELNRQRERASIVICSLNADVYALMELENTTPADTINDLLGATNARCGGAHPFAFVNTGGTLGTDAIRVMIIYRTGIVSPVGSPLVDLDPIHNRPPTAQTFDVVDAANASVGKRFTVVANHFKSKGCPGTGADDDQLDGQGCFADRRTQQATRLLTWVNSTVIPAAGNSDVLLLGDFNSYAKEPPVTTIEGGGYTDLETALLGSSAYSYLFNSELGHLDYAFASSTLNAKVTGVGAWHINADEVPVFDYNDEVFDNPGEATFDEKPDGSALVPPRVVFQPGTPYRASDHDPVLVGLDFNTPPTVDAGGPYSVNEGGSVSVSATGNDSPGDSLSYAWDLDNNGSFETPGQSVTFSAAGLDGPSAKTIRVRVTDTGGLSAVGVATVNVQNVPPSIASVSNNGPINEGGSATVTVSASDPAGAGDPLTYEFDCNNDGTYEVGPQAANNTACSFGDNGSFTVKVRVSDGDGGQATGTTTVVVNNVPPTVNTPAITPEPSTEGASAIAAATFSDPGTNDAPFTCTVDYGDGSGALAATVSGNTCTGPAHVYAAAGSYTVVVTVKDKDNAPGSKSAVHKVIYNFSGFFPPVSNLPAFNSRNSGSAAPIKFALGGNKGLNIIAAGYPKSEKIDCTTGASLGDVQPTQTSGGSGLTYDPATGQYTYVWKTDKAWAGTCRRFSVQLVDGTIHRANFNFSK